MAFLRGQRVEVLDDSDTWIDGTYMGPDPDRAGDVTAPHVVMYAWQGRWEYGGFALHEIRQHPADPRGEA